MLNRVSRKFSKFHITLCTLLVMASISPVMAAGANSSVKLPSPNDTFLQKIVNWMQSILDLVGGAGALFFAFVSGFACIVLWGLAPQQSQAIGKLFRAAVAAIAAFNLAFFIAWLQK